MKPEQVRIEIIPVSPTQAREWLARNPSNRPVAQREVLNIAAAMRKGDFKLNYETIVFDVNGNLLNGQHRLLAIVETGLTVPILCVFGADPTVFDTYDSGRKRTASDVLAIAGEANHTVLAAGVRLYIIVSEREPRFGRSISSQDVNRALEEHPGLREWAAYRGHHTRIQRVAPASVVCALGYAFSTVSAPGALEFFGRLADGAGLEPRHPCLTLRDTMLRDAAALRKAQKHVVVAWFIKAWNAYRTGREMTICKYDTEREAYPTISGFIYKR